jgi:hypothetical protein
VAATRIVPALEEVEERGPGRGQGGELGAIERLTFERGEEALAQSVVVGVPTEPINPLAQDAVMP